ncbi:hypothetical protein [Salmonella enterica]|uniref:hypothetical protein n=1 Tax=Salmonella enterica TaxID=28901 RepID=UPI0037CAD807
MKSRCMNRSFRGLSAGAGNTWATNIYWNIRAVYPLARGTLFYTVLHDTVTGLSRWRGEHFTVQFALDRRGGLSPLARGTLNIEPLQIRSLRFIRWRGNTSHPQQHERQQSVYPRWRGEHSSVITATTPDAGLSAGAGTPAPSLRVQPASRFIRWRGEHIGALNTTINFPGLSRWRGNTLVKCWSLCLWRFIPAGAGNT